MELTSLWQVVGFGAFAAIAVLGALGMATTMSMFRSGIFLMASFFGVAGLFILLLADLIAVLQVMMYLGGMLVMILFMVLFSHDPGGAMMASQMRLIGPERWFSLGLGRVGHSEPTRGAHDGGRGPEHERQTQHNGGHEHRGRPREGGEGHPSMQHDGGGMEMSMSTPIKKTAAVLALALGLWLVGLIILRPGWPTTSELPDEMSAARVGELLMSKYMVAFEGAGLLILLGIFGAAYLARPAHHPDESRQRRVQAARDDHPPAAVPRSAEDP